MNTEFTESDRKLLRSIDDRLKTINGAVNRHDEEIFGDEKRGTPGLVKDMAEIKSTILTARTVVRTLWAIVIFLGVTNLSAVLFFALSQGGGN